jgi:uncharacterized protein DUF5670
MLGRIGGILIFLWLIAFVGHVGGAWVPLLLGIATIVFLVSFLMQLDPESSWA